MIIFLILSIWILSGILAFGITFAYYQGEFGWIAEETKMQDYIFATYIALLGPIGLATSLIGSGFAKYGWRIR